MKEGLKIIGIIYSALSSIAILPLFAIQLFSIMLFDAPSSESNILPYLIVLGIFLIPMILIISNILMWISITKSKVGIMIFFIFLPILYPILFFVIWGLEGMSILFFILYLSLFFGIGFFIRKLYFYFK